MALRIAVIATVVAVLGFAVAVAIEIHGGVEMPVIVDPATPDLIDRGRYLALAGNCAGCHTGRGGRPYAGGRGVPTPFGTVYASNLTPDDATGIGRWTAADFRRAMRDGRSRDGRLLYPAFPYPNYTHVTPKDADALFAYLKTLPAVVAPNRSHALRFPYRSPIALATWRVLFFKPGAEPNDPTRSEEWNRGAYLVRGLGHCGACHSPRNMLGAIVGDDELSGGRMPRQNWYAPSLRSAAEAGVADWPIQEVVALLGTGVAPRASVMGPMAAVVSGSMQHLTPSDLHAIAVFLRSLPQTVRPAIRVPAPDPATMAQGEQIYATQCASCHGRSGEGAAGIYPALAGNRAVMLDVPINLVRIVRSGAFAPATTGNPRPWGMPPFGHVLDDAQIAAVLSYVRGAWGNTAGPLSAAQTRH